MRYKVLACKALFRELSFLSAHTRNVLDITYLRQGLHDTPDLLRRTLQNEIDLIDQDTDIHTNQQGEGRRFDAILLGYGLCSNGTAGLSSRQYPLIVPRADDCIALILGSYARYKELFDESPGTYWYTASWIENAWTPSEITQKKQLSEYTHKYGEENARYILEAESTTKNYNTAAYISWDELAFPEHEQYTSDAAEHFGWHYKNIQGHSGWLRDFVNAQHDRRFAVAMPGEQLAADFSGQIIKACPLCKEAT